MAHSNLDICMNIAQMKHHQRNRYAVYKLRKWRNISRGLVDHFTTCRRRRKPQKPWRALNCFQSRVNGTVPADGLAPFGARPSAAQWSPSAGPIYIMFETGTSRDRTKNVWQPLTEDKKINFSLSKDISLSKT